MASRSWTAELVAVMGGAGAGQMTLPTCYAGLGSTRKLQQKAHAEVLKDHHERSDLLIAGGGFAGLALAIALRQGAGRGFAVTVVRSGAGGVAVERSARLGHRRGGAPPVRGDRRLGRGRRRGAADPRHGDHRQQARRRGAADLSDASTATSKRASRSRTWSRTAHLIDALVATATELGVDLRADRGQRVRARGERNRRAARRRRHDRGTASGRRRRRALDDPRAGRHRHARLELRPVGDRHAPSRTSAITMAAPRSIFCPPVRSRSCR